MLWATQRREFRFGPMPWCGSFCADGLLWRQGWPSAVLQAANLLNLPFSCEGGTAAGYGASLPHLATAQRQTGRQTGRHTDIPQTSKSFATILVAGGMFQHLQRLQMNLFLRGGWISRDLMPLLFTSWSVWWAGRIGPAHEGPAHETPYVFKQCQRRKAKVSKHAVAMWITW